MADAALGRLTRAEQTSDFHCVTTWSYRNARWSGYRFADVFRQIVQPLVKPGAEVRVIVFRCRDGYATALPLGDLLAADVLLADRLDGAPLTIEHGAPLRLVAPAHYGYKSAKHLKSIEFWTDERSHLKSGLARLMDHPRARVELEERGRVAPGWLLRLLYRPLIGPIVRRFRAAMSDPTRT